MSSRYPAVSVRNLGDLGRNLGTLNLGFFASTFNALLGSNVFSTRPNLDTPVTPVNLNRAGFKYRTKLVELDPEPSQLVEPEQLYGGTPRLNRSQISR